MVRGTRRFHAETSKRIVAHAFLRAVFALLRTQAWGTSERSHECERGTHECARYTRISFTTLPATSVNR
jgi:hypothetical protein